MATGPNTVLVLQWQAQGQTHERMIPFVNAYVDRVDLHARRILVDWQPDY
jgi:16S rRNA processing protein RimM